MYSTGPDVVGSTWTAVGDLSRRAVRCVLGAGRQGGIMGKGGLAWALTSESWRGKKLFQDHTTVINLELEEPLETFIHLVTT